MTNVHDFTTSGLASARRSAARAEVPVSFVAQWLDWDVQTSSWFDPAAVVTGRQTAAVWVLAPWLCEVDDARLAA